MTVADFLSTAGEADVGVRRFGHVDAGPDTFQDTFHRIIGVGHDTGVTFVSASLVHGQIGITLRHGSVAGAELHAEIEAIIAAGGQNA